MTEGHTTWWNPVPTGKPAQKPQPAQLASLMHWYQENGGPFMVPKGDELSGFSVSWKVYLALMLNSHSIVGKEAIADSGR